MRSCVTWLHTCAHVSCVSWSEFVCECFCISVCKFANAYLSVCAYARAARVCTCLNGLVRVCCVCTSFHGSLWDLACTHHIKCVCRKGTWFSACCTGCASKWVCLCPMPASPLAVRQACSPSGSASRRCAPSSDRGHLTLHHRCLRHYMHSGCSGPA